MRQCLSLRNHRALREGETALISRGAVSQGSLLIAYIFVFKKIWFITLVFSEPLWWPGRCTKEAASVSKLRRNCVRKNDRSAVGSSGSGNSNGIVRRPS